MKERKPNKTFSRAEISKRVKVLGKQIRADAGKGEILLIGILKGSSVFLADLLRSIKGHVHYEFIDVVQGVSDTDIAEAIQISYLTHFEMDGKNIYLLKDVVSTGVIESYLLSQFRDRTRAEIKLVALLDRPRLRTVDLEVHYRAFEVGSGTFVGYGLEQNGKHGNLPYIGVV